MKSHKLCAILNLNKDFEELAPLNNNRPVAALPFGCRYCVIDFMLSSLSHAGIDSLALFINKSGRSIYDHMRSAREWDMDSAITGGVFTFSQQRWKHQNFMESHIGQDYYADHRLFMDRSHAGYVVVMSGEFVLNLDIDAVVQHYFANEGEITVVYQSVSPEQVVKKPHLKYLKIDEKGAVAGPWEEDGTAAAAQAQDAAYTVEDACTRENEPGEEGKIALNTEIYILKAETLKEIMDRANADRAYMDIGEILWAYLPRYQTNAFEYTGYLASIDSVDSYYEHNMEMLEEKHFNALFHGSKPVITRTNNGAPTFFSEDSDVKDAQCATGCEIYGRVRHSMLFRNVTIGSGAVVTNSIILKGSRIGAGAQLDYVILDKGVTVDDGVILQGSREKLIVVPKNTHIVKGRAL